MNIGILGAGNVGGTLGKRWAQLGHRVVFGSRTPESPDIQELVKQAGASASAAPLAEVMASSDVLVLTTPWSAAKDVLSGANLDGKILIDATNPLLPKLEGLEVGTTTSAAEMIAGWAPGARIVKAFNTVGYNVMGNPVFGDARAVMFYCGDDPAAKRVVRQLVGELGFDGHDAGPLSQARLLEPFALLWISLALKQGYGREIAFQFLTR